ncbi:MAG: aminopeptidase N [Magnetococcales bacterium]|nr:aminopeptidase N [Magnetococcales bacterium]
MEGFENHVVVIRKPSLNTQPPRAIRLQDYTPYPYLVQRIRLTVHLDETPVRVESRLEMTANPAIAGGPHPLWLDGAELDLAALALDDHSIDPGRYDRGREGLELPAPPPGPFVVTVSTRLQPENNTSLEGLYRVKGLFCTQCEAQGFRKITLYPDRPDVMARFTVEIIARRDACPVLLSNGNRVAQGELDGGRHWALWEDPFPKPSYLFALVAGDLARRDGEFITRSGRRVGLEFYTEAANVERCGHALQSLREAMAWDERRFGREYDLDLYMVVATDDFNMGAMENKGLNIFNTQYVLARPETATDDDYEGIQSVIAHEYFHNWTGNRITCRDWFQLSLKEGLTVFRDQEFSADFIDPGVQRVRDVRLLQTHQFVEDAGPTAHPVQPDSYVEINNFYTTTVYNKGAEVVRMLQTLLGRDGFRAGMDRYFERHDGQAVTVEEFVRAMEDANGRDFRQFRRWYRQAGTPVVRASTAFDAARGQLTLTLRQSCPATPGQPTKEPFHIPVVMGLLDGASGAPLPLTSMEGGGLPPPSAGESRGATFTVMSPGDAPAGAAVLERVLELREERQDWTFTGLRQAPQVSLLRHFSAPVRLVFEDVRADPAFLWGHDPDPYNRWAAGQELLTRHIFRLMAGESLGEAVAAGLAAAAGRVLADGRLEPAMKALALTLPFEKWLLDRMAQADPAAVHQARNRIRRLLAQGLEQRLLDTHAALVGLEPYRYHPAAAGRRTLKNHCLAQLALLERPGHWSLAWEQFRHSDNMTDQAAALTTLVHTGAPQAGEALKDFHHRWRETPLVINKWFTIQATNPGEDCFKRVVELTEHADFTERNPNRVRSLIGAFSAGNPHRFHAPNGEGYEFLAYWVLRLDSLNPQIAARMVAPLLHWRRFEPVRQERMRSVLSDIAQRPTLSRDLLEMVAKGLG